MDIQQCGAFIARLRKEQNITQKQLADAIGVTDKAISRWETGKGLPDASSLLALSERFGVSVNELLTGERLSLPLVAEKADDTVLGVLRIRDHEAKKSMHRGVAIAMIILFFFALLFGIAAYDIFKLNGITPSSMHETHRARAVAHRIADGDYDQAVRSIGFVNRDRTVEEDAWVARMQALENQVELRAFQVGVLKKDDGFISGDATLLIADRVSQELYMFRVTVAQQDGIVFGAVACIAGDHNRGAQLEILIGDALSTWNAG